MSAVERANMMKAGVRLYHGMALRLEQRMKIQMKKRMMWQPGRVSEVGEEQKKDSYRKECFRSANIG